MASNVITAYLTLNNRRYYASLSKAEKRTRQFSDKLGSLGGSGLLGITVPLALIGGKMVSLARISQETNTKFNVVFGSMRSKAENLAATLTSSVNKSLNDVKAELAATADLLTGFGIDEGKALEMSETVTQLAADLASFNNIDSGDAFKRIQKGVLGYTAGLVELGIKIDETAIKAKSQTAEFENLDYLNLSGAAKAAAKGQIVLALALEQTTKAQGDVLRSMGSTTHGYNELKKNVLNIAAGLGNELLPVVNTVVGGVNNLLASFESLTPESKKMILWAGAFAGALPIVMVVTSKLINTWLRFKAALTSVKWESENVKKSLVSTANTGTVAGKRMGGNWKKGLLVGGVGAGLLLMSSFSGEVEKESGNLGESLTSGLLPSIETIGFSLIGLAPLLAPLVGSFAAVSAAALGVVAVVGTLGYATYKYFDNPYSDELTGLLKKQAERATDLSQKIKKLNGLELKIQINQNTSKELSELEDSIDKSKNQIRELAAEYAKFSSQGTVFGSIRAFFAKNDLEKATPVLQQKQEIQGRRKLDQKNEFQGLLRDTSFDGKIFSLEGLSLTEIEKKSQAIDLLGKEMSRLKSLLEEASNKKINLDNGIAEEVENQLQILKTREGILTEEKNSLEISEQIKKKISEINAEYTKNKASIEFEVKAGKFTQVEGELQKIDLLIKKYSSIIAVNPELQVNFSLKLQSLQEKKKKILEDVDLQAFENELSEELREVNIYLKANLITPDAAELKSRKLQYEKELKDALLTGSEKDINEVGVAGKNLEVFEKFQALKNDPVVLEVAIGGEGLNELEQLEARKKALTEYHENNLQQISQLRELKSQAGAEDAERIENEIFYIGEKDIAAEKELEQITIIEEEKIKKDKRDTDAQKVAMLGAEALRKSLNSLVSVSPDASGFERFTASLAHSAINLIPKLIGLAFAKEASTKTVFSLPTVAAILFSAMGSIKSSVPKLATGGLAYSETLAVVGEGRNISPSNPEVIAPLSDLKNFLPSGNPNNVQVVVLEATLRGEDIILSGQAYSERKNST